MTTRVGRQVEARSRAAVEESWVHARSMGSVDADVPVAAAHLWTAGERAGDGFGRTPAGRLVF